MVHKLSVLAALFLVTPALAKSPHSYGDTLIDGGSYRLAGAALCPATACRAQLIAQEASRRISIANNLIEPDPFIAGAPFARGASFLVGPGGVDTAMARAKAVRDAIALQISSLEHLAGDS